MLRKGPLSFLFIIRLVLFMVYSSNTVAAATIRSPPTRSIEAVASAVPTVSNHPYKNEQLLCDWLVTASHCREADLTKRILTASMVMHCCVGVFGIWLMTYRGGGFSIAILRDLVDISDGTSIRPRPISCVVFFTTFSCFLKLAVYLPLVLNLLEDKLWLRIALDQAYWVLAVAGVTFYLAGTAYAIPLTRIDGAYAYYNVEFITGSCQIYSIGMFFPPPFMRDMILVASFLIPAIFGAGPAIAAGVMQDLGEYGASDTLRTIRHINWIVILYTVPIAAFYYSVKTALMLLANIHLAKSTLRAEPKFAFTVEYLLTMSSIRFLLFLTSFTTFGAGVLSIVCGSMALIVLLHQDEYLRSEHRVFAIGITFIWTCLLAIGFFLELGTIAIQSFRRKRREQRWLGHTTLTVNYPNNSDEQLRYISGIEDGWTSTMDETTAQIFNSLNRSDQAAATHSSAFELSAPSIIRTLDGRDPSSSIESYDSESSTVYVSVEGIAVNSEIFRHRCSIARSDSSSATPLVNSSDGDPSGTFGKYGKTHSIGSAETSPMNAFDKGSDTQGWRNDRADAKVSPCSLQPLRQFDLSRHPQRHQYQLPQESQWQLGQQFDPLTAEQQPSKETSATGCPERASDDRCRSATSPPCRKPLRSPRRAKTVDSLVSRKSSRSILFRKSSFGKQRSLERIHLEPIPFGSTGEHSNGQRQESAQASERLSFIHLRQQHPRHKVAFKGLSPPPRSPTSPEDEPLALEPWTSLDEYVAMQRTLRPSDVKSHPEKAIRGY